MIHASSVFDAVPDGPIRITSLNLRPDERHPVGAEFGFDNLKLSFFTTPLDPGEMSLEFETNVADATTDPVVVYDDEWEVEALNPNPSDGSTRPFDFKIPFATPFEFDPAEGNLLIDWIFGSPHPRQSSFDRSDSLAPDQSTTWASGADPGAGFGFFSVVTQFEFHAIKEGDVTRDGICDVDDIDALAKAIREGSTDRIFDVNASGNLDENDFSHMIDSIFNTYFGDANLDGEFSSIDFVSVFQAGKYESGESAGWGEGDWNGDGVFSSGDFVAAFKDGGYELGPRAAVAKVPEPTNLVIGVAIVAGLSCRQRKNMRKSKPCSIHC